MPAKIKPSYTDFDDLREDIARASEGWGSIIRRDQCKRLIAVVYKDFWSQSDDRHLPDTFNQITSDTVATCEDCRPNDEDAA